MKNLGVLWLLVFVSLMGFGLTAVPFPLVAEQMGASDFWKTFGGAGVFSVFQLVATPLWGRWSDAVGRKPILVLSSAGSLLAYLWLSQADSLVSLLLARALGGIMSGNLGAAFAYATDVTDVRNRARGLGIVSSAFGVGFAVGPPLGGFLGSGPGGAPSLYGPALAAAGLSFLALLGAAFLLRESLPEESRRPWRRGAAAAGDGIATASDGAAGAAAPASPARRGSPFAMLAARPVLAGLILATMMVAIGGGSLQSVFPFWSRDVLHYSLREIGLQFMVFAALSAVGQAGLIGPLARRFGEKRVAIGSIVGITVSLLVFAVASVPWMSWVGISAFGLANGLFLPAVTSLVSFESEPRNRGAVMGLFNAASSAGRIVGPALSGPVYFNLGAAAPFIGSAVMTALGALLLGRAHARPAAPSQAAPPGDAIG